MSEYVIDESGPLGWSYLCPECGERHGCQRDLVTKSRTDLAEARGWLDEIEKAAGFGPLADVAERQRSRGWDADHEQRLRAKRIVKIVATVMEETEWRHQVRQEAICAAFAEAQLAAADEILRRIREDEYGGRCAHHVMEFHAEILADREISAEQASEILNRQESGSSEPS